MTILFPPTLSQVELGSVINIVLLTPVALVPIVPLPVTSLAPLETIIELPALMLPTLKVADRPPFVHKVLEPLMTSFPEPLAASPMIVVLLRTVPFVMVNVPRPLLPIFMREKVTVPVALSVPLIE